MYIIKRDGQEVQFEVQKIKTAILKAMKYGSGLVNEPIADGISDRIESMYASNGEVPTVQQIESLVYHELIAYGEVATAKAYEGYRAVQEFKRNHNTTDEGILKLVERTNKDVMEENSNKNAVINSTQRDLIAGEVSKDITRRKLLPAKVVQAHDEGIYHFHDMDYFMQPMKNCCLVNIDDMLTNGTVINGKMVESPKSFQVACTVLTQIIAQVSSGQYGGQSVSIKHLGKYLARSKEKYTKLVFGEMPEDMDLTDYLNKKNLVTELLKKELEAGVQTIQYQINTLMTTNGQAPFVTLFLHLESGDEYEEEVALIIEEILKQRLQGIKNEVGVYVTPSFPKLVYVLDEHNCLKGGEYDYLTKLAVKCSAKRLYPDYISAKKMREIYEGKVFSPMGCRSFLSPWKDENGNYKFEGRFNMGVVSLNLPQIGIVAKGDEKKFWKLLDARLDMCKEALMCRYESLKGTISDVSPIHWQHGALARLGKGETIDSLLEGGYSTISLGFIGLYELSVLMTGQSHTTVEGQEFALKVMNRLKEATEIWKEQTNLGFGLYGTPAESLCYRFARIDKAKFGDIKDITDKGYYTNSYHVDVREHINAFDKLNFEAQFQSISTGGCISYIEIPNMNHNLEALEEMVRFIYDHIQYAEFNTKSDYCHVCGFDGEITINEDLVWECPQCHNSDKTKMNVTRRTCGYLGDNFWNDGKTKEILNRVLHI